MSQQAESLALALQAAIDGPGAGGEPPPPRPAPPPLPLPWQPLLTPAQLKRGLSFYGSGGRIERVAARLLAGEPITAVTLGASITRGHGASGEAMRFPLRFFSFLNASFPHRWVLARRWAARGEALAGSLGLQARMRSQTPACDTRVPVATPAPLCPRPPLPRPPAAATGL